MSRIGFESQTDAIADLPVVRSPGQLEDAATVIENTITRLGVAEVGAPLVAFPIRRSTVFLERSEAVRFMGSLSEKVTEPPGAIENAVWCRDGLEL